MGAELRIESLHAAAWKLHGTEYDQAVAARNRFATEIQNRLGHATAATIQHRVDVALGRLLADDLPDLDVAAERAFYQLLALERVVLQVEARIEAGCVFFDSYIDGSFPMSFWEDVLPLLDGQQNPGFMSPKKIGTFLAMVKDAERRLPYGTADHHRERRWELIRFLERAVELGEAVWCDF
jgi:hypothetical protein